MSMKGKRAKRLKRLSFFFGCVSLPSARRRASDTRHTRRERSESEVAAKTRAEHAKVTLPHRILSLHSLFPSLLIILTLSSLLY